MFKHSVVLMSFLCLGLVGSTNVPKQVKSANYKIPVEIPVFDKHPAYQAAVVTVHDGDTIKFRLSLEADVSVDVWVRFLGFNAPELHGPNKDKADEATKVVTELMSRGQVWVKLTGSMTFARYVGSVYVIIDGKPINVSQYMTDLGYNVPQGD